METSGQGSKMYMHILEWIGYVVVVVACIALRKYFVFSPICAPPWCSLYASVLLNLAVRTQIVLTMKCGESVMCYFVEEALKACVWFSMSLFPLPPDKDYFVSLDLETKIMWSRAVADPWYICTLTKNKPVLQNTKIIGLFVTAAKPAVVIKSYHIYYYYLTQQVMFLC